MFNWKALKGSRTDNSILLVAVNNTTIFKMSFVEIFGIRKLESVGYHVVLFVRPHI